jgi:hypothetical protein
VGGPGDYRANDAASLTRAQWQYFLDFYRPQEQEILSEAMRTDFTTEGDEAGLTAAAGVQAGRGTLERNLRRTGVQLTDEERKALDRRTGSTLARATARAENTTRRGLSDSRTNLLRGAVEIGRGVASTASYGLNSAADMAAQREALYQQQKSAASSTNISTAASLAALAFAI